MNHRIPLRRPGAEVGDRHELDTSFAVEPFDLYGRHHEVEEARAHVVVTRVSEGLHLGLSFTTRLRTTCDRTLEPVELVLEFGDSELLEGADDAELSVEDWEFDAADYAARALMNETPMQVFRPDTRPVKPESGDEEIDPRWRGLDGLFASGF
jgi:uncharacterized metal-binding protein YceD (DUF177 family)